MSTKRKTTQQFIEEAQQIHNNQYDYSEVNYIDNKTKVKIICPTHGVFWKRPNKHLLGQGCPKCSWSSYKEKRITPLSEFIRKAQEVHGDFYDYSEVTYNNLSEKVKIICPIHGEFYQVPSEHLRGNGCRKCFYEKRKTEQTLSVNEFIQKSKEVHGDYYDYSEVEYYGCLIKVKIICPEHGEFWQRPNNHLNGNGCPKCYSNVSRYEIELKEFLEGLGLYVESSRKDIISPYEIDLFLPEKDVGIEFNGLYWHSDKFLDKNYHLRKTEMMEEKGFQLIHIFEDEWVHKQKIVKKKLKEILKIDEIYAYL